MSSAAAVHKMQFAIGDRITKAKIFEKEKGQVVYQKAVRNGQRTAKLHHYHRKLSLSLLAMLLLSRPLNLQRLIMY